MSDNSASHNQNESPEFVAGAILGALAGSIAAMLLTPKTGREMRQVVKEYAKEWEGEAGDFAVEARQIMATIQSALEDGADEVKQQVPEVTNQAVQKAAQVAAVLEEGYNAPKDTVSEMVETFKSQWAELEEENHIRRPAHHSRFRGINQAWEAEPPLTDEQKANQAYVAELKEETAEAATEPSTSSRPTLAQYRQAATAKSASQAKEKVSKTPAAKTAASKSPETAKPKTGGRKLLFRRSK
jgi:gas vesicle protein